MNYRFLLVYGGACFGLGAFFYQLDKLEKKLNGQISYWRDRTIAVEQRVHDLTHDEAGREIPIS